MELSAKEYSQKYVDALNKQVSEVMALSEKEQNKILSYMNFFHPERLLKRTERIH